MGGGVEWGVLERGRAGGALLEGKGGGGRGEQGGSRGPGMQGEGALRPFRGGIDVVAERPPQTPLTPPLASPWGGHSARSLFMSSNSWSPISSCPSAVTKVTSSPSRARLVATLHGAPPAKGVQDLTLSRGRPFWSAIRSAEVQGAGGGSWQAQTQVAVGRRGGGVSRWHPRRGREQPARSVLGGELGAKVGGCWEGEMGQP